jgi:hypothetical protein
MYVLGELHATRQLLVGQARSGGRKREHTVEMALQLHLLYLRDYH